MATSSAGLPSGGSNSANALWVVRHAQPMVAPGLCYGATDMRADQAATRDAALALARQLPDGTRVFSSPMQRCTQLTQELLRLRADLQAAIEPRLAEMDFGCWEGQRWDAIPKAAIDEWTADFGRLRFGGKESVQALVDRVAAVWDETRASGLPAAWITHAGVIRAAMLLRQNIRTVQRSDQWPGHALEFGAWHRLG